LPNVCTTSIAETSRDDVRVSDKILRGYAAASSSVGVGRRLMIAQRQTFLIFLVLGEHASQKSHARFGNSIGGFAFATLQLFCAHAVVCARSALSEREMMRMLIIILKRNPDLKSTPTTILMQEELMPFAIGLSRPAGGESRSP